MKRLATLSLVVVLGGVTAGCATTPAVSQPPQPETSASQDGADAAEESGLPSISSATSGLDHRPGLLDLWVDEAKGKVWLELSAPGEDGVVGEYLYVEGLASGLGSNPVGLDRGQLGETRLVRLRRVGGRLLVEVPNLRFRAESDDALERRAVDESFADSVLWAGEVAAEDSDGSFLVDLTPFVVRDAHGVVDTLAGTDQGTFRLDAERSVLDADAVLAFPDNLELEALLTFASGSTRGVGWNVRGTAPLADSFSLVQHHSLIRLPDDGFEPRELDPRSGYFGISYLDYATPLDQPIRKSYAVRHRLEKQDPTAARSKAVEPLVYYLDPGTPEPVRSALMEGASWWTEAFEAAGFEDAFRVELLPADAHPLDVRYNVIQWVHRSTRGWSYGGGIIDPRTGEMIKGHVSLGSLRVRQDRLIFEGLAGAGETGTGEASDPVQMALARLRQLSAHEVGHTLGLAHNFAASTYGRESVMDYPAPLVEPRADGSLDFSSVYDTGIGAWDVQAIRWGYSQMPPGLAEAQVEERLDAIVSEGRERGYLYLTDSDARPVGSAHPRAHLWDNYGDPVEGLEKTLRVREIALEGFGPDNLPAGEPLAVLEETLAPIYFYHRYQLEAAVKLVGGLDYSYSLAGGARDASGAEGLARPVPAADQRRALGAVLSALDPEVLDLSEDVLAHLLPRPPGVPGNRELFRGSTGLTFDPLGAASTAADLALSGLLHPQRAARLVDFGRRDPSALSFDETLRVLSEATFGGSGPDDARLAEIRRAVQAVVVARLIDLAEDPASTVAVRSRVEAELTDIVGERLGVIRGSADAEGAHRLYLARQIERFLSRDRADAVPLPEPPEAPPGSPIGSGDLLPLTLDDGFCSAGFAGGTP